MGYKPLPITPRNTDHGSNPGAEGASKNHIGKAGSWRVADDALGPLGINFSSQEVMTIRACTPVRANEFAVRQSVLWMHSKDFKRQYKSVSGNELSGRKI